MPWFTIFVDLAGFLIYFLVLFGVGLLASRRGRSVIAWVIAAILVSRLVVVVLLLLPSRKGNVGAFSDK